ncbi:cupin [Burkholderia latens]|nr:cupin [Burkholderia latens]
MRYQNGGSADGTIVPIDGAPQLAPSGAPLAELLLTPTPQCRNQTDYRSADGQFTCGTWDSTPYHRTAMLYHHYELMYLLEGSVTFVDEAGRRATFSRGDIFLVEQGAKCSWESLGHVAKVYAIFRPA